MVRQFRIGTAPWTIPKTSAHRFAAATPGHFRFSVKLSRVFTHDRRLADTAGLDDTLAGIGRLGKKFGVLLVQLPPGLTFEAKTAARFFERLRKLHGGNVALESRHPSWVTRPRLSVLSAARGCGMPPKTRFGSQTPWVPAGRLPPQKAGGQKPAKTAGIGRS